MPNYHVNEEGEPGLCRAKITCPFGGDEAHYSSKAQARAAYEQSQTLPLVGVRQLSENEVQALTSYQMGSYEYINGPLRSNSPIKKKRWRQDVEVLDSLFSRTLSVPPLTVYRVTGTGDDYLPDRLEPGTVIEEPGFLSTSEDPRFAESCIEEGLNDEYVNTTMEILVDPSVSCVRLSDYSKDFGQESEVLFGRDTRFEVVSDSGTEEDRHIVLRMLS